MKQISKIRSKYNNYKIKYARLNKNIKIYKKYQKKIQKKILIIN